MDRLVTLQALTVSRDPTYGAEVQSWATLAQVWAEKLELSGREFIVARQTAAERLVRLRIDWRADVTVKNRVQFDGRTLNIVAVLEQGRRRGMVLMCEETNG